MLFLCAATMASIRGASLLPRSTKTAATVLVQVYSVRRTSGAPMRLSEIAAACRKTDRKTSRGPPQRSTGRLKEKPALYLWEEFEEF